MEICSTSHQEETKTAGKKKIYIKIRVQHLLADQTCLAGSYPTLARDLGRLPQQELFQGSPSTDSVHPQSNTTISLGRLCSLGPASSGRCRTKLATPGVLSHFLKLMRASQHAKHRKGRRGCWCSVLLRLSSFGSCRTHECPLHNGKDIKQKGECEILPLHLHNLPSDATAV